MIGIVFCNDVNMCPYLDKYLRVLSEKKAKYRVLLWNRDGKDRQYGRECIIYKRKSDLYLPKLKKIPDYIGFSAFLYKTINKYKFDKLVVLTSLPAVILLPLLYSKYQGRYIYDFRDLSFERNTLYRNIIKGLVGESYFTCVSSPAFKEIIGESTIITHNFRYDNLKQRKRHMSEPGSKINILHIGISRGLDFNKRLADIFGNNKCFDISIVGTGNDMHEFLEYIEKYDNFHVKGTYDNSEKEKYISECDALLYYYPCSFNNNRALANKYYDGLIYKKPLIGNINTYSGKRIKEKNIGLAIDLEKDDAAELIYKYFKNINCTEYEDSAENELKRILEEDKAYCSKIEDFVEGK